MKERLRQWAERIDALELRERALLLVAAVVVLYLLVDQRVKQDITNLELQLSTQRQQLKLLTEGREADPLQSRRRQRDALQKELAELDARIREQLGALVEPAQAAEVLEQVLSRQPGLSLVSLQASSEPLLIVDEDDDEVRSGLGLRYLQALEAMPWKFFWQTVELTVQGYPHTETLLKLYTVGAHDD